MTARVQWTDTGIPVTLPRRRNPRMLGGAPFEPLRLEPLVSPALSGRPPGPKAVLTAALCWVTPLWL